jgi:hypothetical protein
LRGWFAEFPAPQKQIRARQVDGLLAVHVDSFPNLESYFANDPQVASRLLECEQVFTKARDTEIETIRKEIDPLKTELGILMNRFPTMWCIDRNGRSHWSFSTAPVTTARRSTGWCSTRDAAQSPRFCGSWRGLHFLKADSC